MSISQIQRNRKIKQFIKELVQKGIEPNNYELNTLLREYFNNHIMGMPYYSPIKQKPYEESSKDDYNHNFLTFKEDIETAYEANIQTNNKAVAIQEYYDTEKSKVFHAIDKIVLRTKCLQESLRSNKRIQEYVEVFDSLYGLELYGDESRNIPYTTSFVDLFQKKVVNEKTNAQVNKLSIVDATVTITGVDNFNGYESNGELNKILNDTINDVFIFTGKSKENKEKSLNLIIDLGSLMTFNTVFFKSTSSNDMIFTLALSENGNDFYTVYDIESKDLIEWNFEPKTSRYIKITCTKQEADGQNLNTQGLNVYEYYYIFKNVTIALESYESQSTMITKPIEFDNLTNFIKLDAKDMNFANTRINYFIGFDNGTSKLGWDAIPNHEDHLLFMFEKRNNIANYGTNTDYGIQSALTELYEVFKLPHGVNINSLKVTPGYNMWSVERFNRNEGDYDDGFDLKESDVTEYIKNCTKTQLFMDCENYNHFEIRANTLYIFTQYVDVPNTTSIYNKLIHVNDDTDIDRQVNNVTRLFVNGYEQITGDNGLYSINLKKGVNKIQIAIYAPASHVVNRYLFHNLNFKEITNNVFAFKPMHYTNVNMLTKSLEPTYQYFTVKNNIIYVNVDPSEIMDSTNIISITRTGTRTVTISEEEEYTEQVPREEEYTYEETSSDPGMGYFISYYGLKENMQQYFKSDKLRFRLMAILNTKSKNVSPSIINFRLTGK